MDERIEQARLLYEQAIFGGESAGLVRADEALDAVEADLALARGRVTHARFLADGGEEDPAELELFQRAADLYRTLGDTRGEGEALFWIGIVHQVARHDNDASVPFFERSHSLASSADDRTTMAYALRHLGVAAHIAGDLTAARERLEESTRLRREIGMLPGVAANLIGLAHVAIAEGRPGDARAILDEAAAIAESTGAHGVTRWIDQARAELDG